MSYFDEKTCRDRAPYLEKSPILADAGRLTGKHPKDIPAGILRALEAPSTPAAAIRAKCIECCCGDTSEVRKCVSVDCPLWPMRMGRNPFHGRARPRP